jgi:hypothetical protein
MEQFEAMTAWWPGQHFSLKSHRVSAASVQLLTEQLVGLLLSLRSFPGRVGGMMPVCLDDLST